MSNEDSDFPRPVYDQQGRYTVSQAGVYTVRAPLANRFSSLTYLARDLGAALEMLGLCAVERREDLDKSEIKQALWHAAIVLYAKGFKKRNNARKGLDAEHEIAGQLSHALKNKHDYMMDLRDKYVAHDDGLGEDKVTRMGFPSSPPRNMYEIGFVPGNARIVSLGADKANELLPLFETVKKLVDAERDKAYETLLKTMIQTNFKGVELTGRFVKQPLVI